MRKRVLLIAYYFPPLGGGGVQRTLKFARYLPLYDWEPTVLTVSNPDHPLWDYSLLKELPSDLPVFRTPAFEFSRWEKRLFSLFKSDKKKDGGKKEGESVVDKNANLPARRLKNLLKKIYIYLTSWLRIPDEKVGWVPSALLEGLSLLKFKKIDLVYTTSPPHSSHLVGLLLGMLSGKPWVADFRDDWLEENQNMKRFSSFRMKVEKYLADKVFTKAALVIGNTEFQKDTYLKNYPGIRRIEAIYNGFDAEDLNRAGAEGKKWQDDKFHICHSGYFYPGTALLFFEIWKEFLGENPELRGKIQLDLVGYLEKEYRDWIIQNSLEEEIKSWGYVEHQESIAFLFKSHLLLYLIDTTYEFCKGNVAGKLFEYMACGKPILALAPKDGESEKIILRANSGWVLDLKDKQGIKTKLKELYELFLKGEFKILPDRSFIEQFERKYLTSRLSLAFGKCLSEK